MIQSPVSKATSASVSMAVGAATFWDYAPKVAGLLASLAGLIWIGIQAYYFIKEKKKQGL